MSRDKKWLLEYKGDDYDGPFRGRGFNGFTTDWLPRWRVDEKMMVNGYSVHPTGQRNFELYGEHCLTDTRGWD